MADQFRLTRSSQTWQIITRKGAGAASEAAWVTLGGCPDQIVAVRVWLSLVARKGRT